MAVLALGAVSLLSAAEGHTARISDVSERVTARWAADYELAALRLGLDGDTITMPTPGADSRGSRTMLGTDFDVVRKAALTDDPDLIRVTVEVARAGSDRVLYLIDGYLDAGVQP